MSITILVTLLFTLPELFQNIFHVLTNTVMLKKCQISESNRPSIQVLKHLFDQCLTILREKRLSSKALQFKHLINRQMEENASSMSGVRSE